MDWHRIILGGLESAILGAVYVLVLWGAFSLLGFNPHWVKAHHLNDFYFWTWLIYAIAYEPHIFVDKK